jgi:hypothetical protein
MGAFDDRKKGFEERFRYEQERDFMINARRNRLLGNWAADRLGLPAGEREEYARSVVLADLQEPGDGDVIGKVEQDLRAKSVAITKAELQAKLEEFAKEAQAQIMNR